MRGLFALVFQAGLAILFATSAAAQLDSFEVRRQAAYDVLLEDLEEYSDWCRGKKLFLERRPILDLILELEPENAVALKALGWKKDAKGNWKEPAKPKVFKNFDDKALQEAPTQYRAALAPYVGLLEAMLGEDLSLDQQEIVCADILRYDPNNERVHTLRGDVWLVDKWVLAETALARERRAELREFVRTYFEEAPAPEDVPPNEKEAGLGLKWKTVVATPRARVLGTGEREEVLRVAQALNATEDVFHAVFGEKGSLPATCTAFLLADPNQAGVFIENYPGLTDEQRSAYALLEGTGLQGTDDYAFWSDYVARRVDGIVRIALGWLFAGGLDVTLEQAWIYEGFGLYMTRLLVRTRLNWFVQPSPDLDANEEKQLRDRLMDPETNWMAEAYAVLARPGSPKLADLVKKRAIEMTVEDMLYAYVFAAFLLETQAEKTPDMLRKIGGGAAPMITIEQTLGMKRDVLERKVLRWLSERR